MSQYPVINAGTTPTIAMLQAMIPQVAYKNGDQSVTSSTTLVNDTALVVPVAANATYKVEALVYYTGGTHATADFKYNFTYPSGCSSASVRYLGLSTALAVQYGTVVLGGAGAFGTNGASNVLTVDLEFNLAVSSTAGTLQLQWAQNTSSATATTVKAGSFMTARRLA